MFAALKAIIMTFSAAVEDSFAGVKFAALRTTTAVSCLLTEVERQTPDWLLSSASAAAVELILSR